MKILKIVLLSLAAVLAVAILGLFIFIKTFDLNHYLPQITKIASDALGRNVSIDRAGLHVGLDGIILDLDGLHLAGTTPTAPPLLTADKVHGQVEVMPLLLKRQIQVSSMTFTAVKVYVEDPQAPLTIVIASARAQIPNFSLEAPFTVNVDASLASTVENLHATGQVQLNTSTSQTTVSNLVFNTDLAQLNVSDLKTITPALAQAPLPAKLSGKLNVQVARLQVSPKGLQNLQADAVLTIGAAGTVNAQVQIQDSGHVDAKIIANGVSIADLVDVNTLPVVVKGNINGNVTVAAQGIAPDVLMKSLKGQGSANIANGTIESLRIFQATLGQALGKIPGLSQVIDGLVNSTLQRQLGSETLALDKAEAQFSIADSVVTLENAVALTRAFELNAKGTIGFDMNTAITVNMLVAADLSASLVKEVKPLEYLQENGRIKIDGQVQGVLPNTKFVPSVTVKNVTTNALIQEGVNQLQKVIEKNPEVGQLLNSIFGAQQ